MWQTCNPRAPDSDCYELAGRSLRWPSLEAHNQPHVQSSGKPLEGVEAHLVLTALDPGDRGVARADTAGQLGLGET